MEGKGTSATEAREKGLRVKIIKVTVIVEQDGKEIKHVRYDKWLDTAMIEEIAKTIDDAIGGIDEA
ncbi:MAG: hypothetical protein U9N61_00075 [Euryarchaeota archaeon]|nr:hypothetical protein [Euryarchaeota archaeon]